MALGPDRVAVAADMVVVDVTVSMEMEVDLPVGLHDVVAVGGGVMVSVAVVLKLLSVISSERELVLDCVARDAL